MFNDYLITYLPIIYDDASFISKIVRLIALRHSLSALFISDSRNFNNDYFINYLKGLKISTTLTCSIFFLTLLFSLQVLLLLLLTFSSTNSTPTSFQMMMAAVDIFIQKGLVR